MAPPRTRHSARTRSERSNQQHLRSEAYINSRKSEQSGASENTTPVEDSSGDAQAEIHEDDLCPICQLLLCHPVITQCNHVLCKSCMATWADVSLAAPMTIVSVDEEARDFDAATGLEARCPMCRTQTTASLDDARAETLRAKYPTAYSEREAEERAADDAGDNVQTITVYIGNKHRFVEASADDYDQNTHEWTFFVRPSRTDIIEEVQIFLHPTFRTSRIIRARPPYEVRRVGWGYFTITAGVILKAGYRWVSSDAEESPDGAPHGMLRLDWTLDFSSFGATGAMGRSRLKVRNDREWDDVSEEGERDAAEWNRMVAAYERDGRYEPPAE